MAIIPHLIARYAAVLYALAALGAFFYVWAAILSRRKEMLALFAMERERAVSQGLRSWLMAGVCVLLAFGVYGVSNFVVPNLPLDQADETPMVAIQVTPTVNPTPSLTPVKPTATLASLPTVGPIPTPLDRPPDTPTPPPTVEGNETSMPAACIGAGTQIFFPGNGDLLSGVVEIRGTASIPDFSFYKFEIQWPNSEEWVTLQSFDVPVAGGTLGSWDTTTLSPGAYKLRLVVVDNTSNFPEPCVINVIVESPTPGS